MLGSLVSYKVQGMQKEAVAYYFQVIPQRLPGRTEENHKSRQSVFGSMFETRPSRIGGSSVALWIVTLRLTVWFILDV